MIGKVVQGQNFLGVLKYLHHKSEAQQIGGNMAGKTPQALSAEFHVSRELNWRLQLVVCHTSLSLPKQERLSDQVWQEIATDYLKAMGYSDCQHVIYRHHDQDHDHIHIVVSRIRMTDGATVKDSWEKRRAEAVLRQLEQQYGLEVVPSSHGKLQKAPTVGEMRKFEQTGEVPIRLRLQTQIDAAVGRCTAIAELIQHLQQHGIAVKLRITEDRRITGISYSLEGIAFSGNKLGRAYTFPGLQKHKGMTYDEATDFEATCQAVTGELAAIPAQPEPKAGAEPSIAPTPKPPIQQSPTAKPDYPTLWQHYAQGLQSRNPVTLNSWVARRALAEGRSPQEVAQTLLQSPFVQEMVEKRREPEKIRAYINQTVHQAYQQQRQPSNQSNQVSQQKQRSGDLEL
jgi:hypothetical protein